MHLAPFFTLLLPLLVLKSTSLSPPPLQTLTLHHLPSSSTPSSPLPLAILTYHPHHPYLSNLTSFTPPPNTTSSSSSEEDAITQVAIHSPKTGHLTSSATATYSFHPPYKGRFRILVDPVTGEAVAASYHAWLPKSKSRASNGKTSLKATDENDYGDNKSGGKGDFDILTIKQPPPVIFDKPVKGKGKGGAAGAGAGGVGGEGEGEVEEKTFLQKYWWVLLGVAVLAVSGGGGEK